MFGYGLGEGGTFSKDLQDYGFGVLDLCRLSVVKEGAYLRFWIDFSYLSCLIPFSFKDFMYFLSAIFSAFA